MDESYDRVVAYLRSLPQWDEVVWNDHTLVEGNVVNGYGAIQAPGIEEACSLSWVWDIDVPGLHEDLGLQFGVEPDAWGPSPQWSPQTIEGALHRWIEAHAGRTDIRLRWDRSIGEDLLAEVDRIRQEVLADPRVSHQVSDNVIAADRAMVFLGQLTPEHRALIVDTAQHAADVELGSQE